MRFIADFNVHHFISNENTEITNKQIFLIMCRVIFRSRDETMRLPSDHGRYSPSDLGTLKLSAEKPFKAVFLHLLYNSVPK